MHVGTHNAHIGLNQNNIAGIIMKSHAKVSKSVLKHTTQYACSVDLGAFGTNTHTHTDHDE